MKEKGYCNTSMMKAWTECPYFKWWIEKNQISYLHLLIMLQKHKTKCYTNCIYKVCRKLPQRTIRCNLPKRRLSLKGVCYMLVGYHLCVTHGTLPDPLDMSVAPDSAFHWWQKINKFVRQAEFASISVETLFWCPLLL